ncbi:hypothetical protein GWK47_009946 [Chionoecetes opilio]|uniref:Uncharacterized protein n=1 Tax=Chionoecetes opilio TaxID=41210 RepID=A0A8J4Y3Y2_CHIOP|nr:hypothetical protein GWK47_009946 [Chionoecetes opilio]
MGLLCFAVILIVIFFNTPYKRLEAERASSTSNISSSSSSHSLNATSGYDSESVSRTTTVSSRVSRNRPTLLPKDEAETTEAEPECEQCHLRNLLPAGLELRSQSTPLPVIKHWATTALWRMPLSQAVHQVLQEYAAARAEHNGPYALHYTLPPCTISSSR